MNSSGDITRCVVPALPGDASDVRGAAWVSRAAMIPSDRRADGADPLPADWRSIAGADAPGQVLYPLRADPGPRADRGCNSPEGRSGPA
jgi:hypothetical protein